MNWENENTRKAIYDSAVGFWLHKGVDGFRIDTAGLYSKIPGLPDAPITDPSTEFQNANPMSNNGPRIHEFHKEMHKYMEEQITDGREIMTVGEVGQGDPKTRLQYTSAREKEISELFYFEHTSTGTSPTFRYNIRPFTLKDWKLGIADSFQFINGTDAWSTIYLENHDQPRSITRFGNDSPEWRATSGKLLALLEVSLTGTLYVYQGQELGQVNLKGWPIEKYEDVEVHTNYKIIKEKYGDESVEMKKFKEGVALIARDHSRTPFPWTSEEPYAGFTRGEKPWFGVNESFREGINATDELKDPNSVLNFWKKALKLRKEHKDIMVYGYDFEFYDLDNERLFMYTKRNGDRKLFAALNFSGEEVEFSVPVKDAKYTPFFGNYDNLEAEFRVLQPWEGRLYYVE